MPHAAWCAEVSEWVNHMTGIGLRAGALRNASLTGFRTGWTAAFAIYNGLRNRAAPEWLLSQLGIALARSSRARASYRAAREQQLGGTATDAEAAALLDASLVQLARSLALEACEGLEGGGGGRRVVEGGGSDDLARWVAAAEQHDSLVRLLEQVDAALVTSRAQHATRHAARDSKLADEAAATALHLALSTSAVARATLNRYHGARSRSGQSRLSDLQLARELVPRLAAKLGDVPSSPDVELPFKAAYCRAQSLAVRAGVVRVRLTGAGRARGGLRGVAADEALLGRHVGDLALQLRVLAVLQPRVPDARWWVVPSIAACKAEAGDVLFPATLGRLRFRLHSNLMSLLDLLQRSEVCAGRSVVAGGGRGEAGLCVLHGDGHACARRWGGEMTGRPMPTDCPTYPAAPPPFPLTLSASTSTL